MRDGILLATINAKWIHPSLALRLLKANLGSLQEHCEIMEFALRQPLREKTEPILAARPRILGLSVSIWNLAATVELLKELRKAWKGAWPFVVLGGPEVSHLPEGAEIFHYADCRVLGEGETAFRELCETVYGAKGADASGRFFSEAGERNILVANREFKQVNLDAVKTGYGLYTDEDLRKKLTYVEASRGCPYSCEFCLSAHDKRVREFPLEPFLEEMDALIQRGARTFKFLDRSFNLNIARARRTMEFFLNRLERARLSTAADNPPFTVHFEMVPFRFPPELMETVARFPPGSLRLEIGIQTLNTEVSALIGRPSDPMLEIEALRLLRQKTNAIIHADLIAGLPGENLASFGKGFDLLWEALSPPPGNLEPQTTEPCPSGIHPSVEVQLGILKLLPGAPIARHSAAFGMCYNPAPPYEVTETAAIPAHDLDRIKNFARFWELIVNRNLADPGPSPVFDRFMALADSLLARFGRNWGIPKADLVEALDPGKITFPVARVMV
ncbi:MAG: radical SAM protein [Treponema sp.]|nr:radical SAM protein [Treponema sp.]